MAWGRCGDARVGADVVEAVAGRIVLRGVRLVGNGHVQLSLEGIKQILVDAD